jgi:hypothetical protein
MNRGQRGDDTSDLVGRSGVFRVARGSPESGLDIGGVDVESGQHRGDDAGFCLAEGDQQVAISDPPLASVGCSLQRAPEYEGGGLPPLRRRRGRAVRQLGSRGERAGNAHDIERSGVLVVERCSHRRPCCLKKERR